MATRETLQHRSWLAAFVVLQLVGLWQWNGAWVLREVFGHVG